MTPSPLGPRALIGALTAIAVAGVPIAGLAADSDTDWHTNASIYLWGAAISGETAGGAEINVGFDTLINHLNMAFMGAFEARKGKWGLGADVIYLDVGAALRPCLLQNRGMAGCHDTGCVADCAGTFNPLSSCILAGTYLTGPQPAI